MKIRPIPVATHAEVSSSGVIITFDDGRCAVYSMALLNATFDQAQEVFEDDPDT